MTIQSNLPAFNSYLALTGASPYSVDLSKYHIFSVNVAVNSQFNFINPFNGASLLLGVYNSAATPVILTFNPAGKWPSATAVLTVAPLSTNIYTVLYRAPD